MSRKDRRKALVVVLPDGVRAALRAQASPGDGLSATARRLIRSADLAEVLPGPTRCRHGRPLVLQLPKRERAQLSGLALRLGVSEDTALCYALENILAMRRPSDASS